jgi:hypothetical protein
VPLEVSVSFAINLSLFRNLVVPGGTVVENSTHNHKIEGSNPAVFHRERDKKKSPTYQFYFVDRDCPLERETFVGISGQSAAGTSGELDLRRSSVDRRAHQQVVEEKETSLL